MRKAALWASLVLAQTSTYILVNTQYVSLVNGQKPVQLQLEEKPNQELEPSEKRAGTMAEPTCDELRVMWRFSKRQSRAAESTNELPVYRDPFNYNVWETDPSRSANPADRGK